MVCMMKHVLRLAVFAIGLTALAPRASAQSLPWEGRGFISVNFGMQARPESVVSANDTFSIYDETGKITTSQTIDNQAPFFDLGGGVRIAGNFGFGFAYTRLRTESAGEMTAEVPSPLYYDQPRMAASKATALEHVEDGYHFQVVWMLPFTDRFGVLFSGGPTLFKLKQGVMTSPKITEVGPPYTTVNMTATESTLTDSQIGFNVGVDLTYRFANSVGIGAMARYAAGTVTLAPAGGTPFDVNVGGFQFGGGLRIRF
jgi:hypothetical protein